MRSSIVQIVFVGAWTTMTCACGPGESPGGGNRGGSGGSGGSPATGGSTTNVGVGGATGGSTAQAGSPGTGGSSNAGCPPPARAANEELVIDFEDGTGQLPETSGRAGGFYMYNDMSTGGVQTPAPSQSMTIAPTNGGHCSTYAMNMKGMGFTVWGAGMGTDLNNVYDSAAMKSNKRTYDASAYAGVTFWARIGDGSTAKMVRFNVANKDTDPLGGVCMPEAKCNDHFGQWLTFTPTWTKYTVMFADMKQQGFGAPVAAFDPKTVYAVQFQVKQATMFDVSVDDVALIRK